MHLLTWASSEGRNWERRVPAFFTAQNLNWLKPFINNTHILTPNFPLFKENNDYKKIRFCRCNHSAQLRNQLVFIPYTEEKDFCSLLLMVNKSRLQSQQQCKSDIFWCCSFQAPVFNNEATVVFWVFFNESWDSAFKQRKSKNIAVAGRCSNSRV